MVEQWSEESRTERFAELLGNSRLIPIFGVVEQWFRTSIVLKRVAGRPYLTRMDSLQGDRNHRPKSLQHSTFHRSDECSPEPWRATSSVDLAVAPVASSRDTLAALRIHISFIDARETTGVFKSVAAVDGASSAPRLGSRVSGDDSASSIPRSSGGSMPSCGRSASHSALRQRGAEAAPDRSAHRLAR